MYLPNYVIIPKPSRHIIALTCYTHTTAFQTLQNLVGIILAKCDLTLFVYLEWLDSEATHCNTTATCYVIISVVIHVHRRDLAIGSSICLYIWLWGTHFLTGLLCITMYVLLSDSLLLWSAYVASKSHCEMASMTLVNWKFGSLSNSS